MVLRIHKCLSVARGVVMAATRIMAGRDGDLDNIPVVTDQEMGSNIFPVAAGAEISTAPIIFITIAGLLGLSAVVRFQTMAPGPYFLVQCAISRVYFLRCVHQYGPRADWPLVHRRLICWA